MGLLALSLGVNYVIGRRLTGDGIPAGQRLLLVWLGVSFNLGLLAYYKYANFFVDNLNRFTGASFHLETVILPWAISFFTFQQIAFVVDAYQGKADWPRLLPYCLFVTFFPQLIAGPIVHHREMMPQFLQRNRFRWSGSDFGVGLTIFLLGLFNKVIIADEVAGYATSVFNGAEAGMTLTFFEAWTGTLSYTMQLYFDFSAYSDMAIGLGQMFGIRLPMNFNSPYKATSIIEFWRRWHIDAFAILAGLPLHPVGGESLRPGTPSSELDANDVVRRSLARCRVNLRGLGWIARGLSDDQPWLAIRARQEQGSGWAWGPTEGERHPTWAGGGGVLGSHLVGGDGFLGVFPRALLRGSDGGAARHVRVQWTEFAPGVGGLPSGPDGRDERLGGLRGDPGQRAPDGYDGLSLRDCRGGGGLLLSECQSNHASLEASLRDVSRQTQTPRQPLAPLGAQPTLGDGGGPAGLAFLSVTNLTSVSEFLFFQF